MQPTLDIVLRISSIDLAGEFGRRIITAPTPAKVADIVHLQHLPLPDLGLEDFGVGERLRQQGDDRAIAHRVGIELTRGADAAAARPMLEDDVRIARDVPLEMIGGQRRIHVIRAAGRVTEHEVTVLPL